MESESYNVSSPSNQSQYIIEDGYESIMDVAIAINRYYLWVILVFGLPGNIAAIFTIFRMRHLGSFAFYVVLLAVVDSLALAIKIIDYHLQLIARHVNIHAAGCKFVAFMANFLITYANWILVLMAVERLLAVKFPLKIHSFKYRNSVIATVIVGILLALPYLPVLWVVSLDDWHGCVVISTDQSLMVFLTWTHRSLYGFAPFVTLLVSNLIIARVIRSSFRLRQAMRNVSRVNSTSSSSSPDSSIQRQIMVMLFTTTFVFVLFTFPRCAYSIAEIYWTVTVGTKEDATKYLLRQIAFVLCDSNHAVNFYLYFFSARKFRSQFVRNSIFSSSNRGRTAARL